MPDCRRCHAITERDRQRRIKMKANGLIVQKVATQISRSRGFARTNNLINELAEKLCGPNNLMDFWLNEINRLKGQRRYLTRMFRLCELVLNAHTHCESAFDLWLERASVEELRDMRQEWIRCLFLEDREVVAAAAKQAGVTVVWPPKTADAST